MKQVSTNPFTNKVLAETGHWSGVAQKWLLDHARPVASHDPGAYERMEFTAAHDHGQVTEKDTCNYVYQNLISIMQRVVFGMSGTIALANGQALNTIAGFKQMTSGSINVAADGDYEIVGSLMGVMTALGGVPASAMKFFPSEHKGIRNLPIDQAGFGDGATCHVWVMNMMDNVACFPDKFSRSLLIFPVGSLHIDYYQHSDEVVDIRLVLDRPEASFVMELPKK